jgi:hypothetical protein
LLNKQPSPSAARVVHIHISKAAEELPQLIDAYKARLLQKQAEPQVTPIILRHREGRWT